MRCMEYSTPYDFQASYVRTSGLVGTTLILSVSPRLASRQRNAQAQPLAHPPAYIAEAPSSVTIVMKYTYCTYVVGEMST